MYLDVHEGTWRVVSPRLLIEWWGGDWEWDCLWDGFAEGTWRALCIACSVAIKLKVRYVSRGTTLAAERVSERNMAAMIMITEWKQSRDGGACMVGVAYVLTLVTGAFERVGDRVAIQQVG